MESGYPRSIESDFPGIGEEVDAVGYHYGSPHLLTHLHMNLWKSPVPVCGWWNPNPIFYSHRIFEFLPQKPSVWVQLQLTESHSCPETELSSQRSVLTSQRMKYAGQYYSIYGAVKLCRAILLYSYYLFICWTSYVFWWKCDLSPKTGWHWRRMSYGLNVFITYLLILFIQNKSVCVHTWHVFE